MMAAWIGEDRFRRGVRAYLRAHAGGSATAGDLTAAIAAEGGGPDLARTLTGFAEQPGVPWLAASVVCAAGAPPAVRLTALPGPRRREAGHWRVPVCVLAGDAARHERVCGVLDGDELRLPLARCPSWVWPNAGAVGFFRARLAADDWRALAVDGWGQLGAEERLATAQDLARDHPELTFEWVPRMVAEARAPAIEWATLALERGRRSTDAPSRARLAARVDGLLGARARALGWLPRPDDTVDDQRLRRLVVPLVAALGDPQLQRVAVALAADWRALPDVARRDVLRAAVRADPRVHDRLLSELQAGAGGDRARDLALALGAVRDEARLRSALELLLDDRLPTRVTRNIVESAADDPETRAVADAWVMGNLAALGALGRGEIAGSILAPITASCDRARVEPLRARFRAELPGGEARWPVGEALDDLDRCADAREVAVPAMERWLATAP